MRELDSRAVPYELPLERNFALNRPPHLRQPWPVEGQRVRLRRQDWSTDTTLATVLDVQPRDDYADPWLWHTVRDVNGHVVLRDGVPLRAEVADPWPWVRVRPDDNVAEVVETREARMRGSGGWLPLTWTPNPEVIMPWEMVPPELQPIMPADAVAHPRTVAAPLPPWIQAAAWDQVEQLSLWR